MKGMQIWPPKIRMAKIALLRFWFSGESTSYTISVMSPSDVNENHWYTYELRVPLDTTQSTTVVKELRLGQCIGRQGTSESINKTKGIKG